MLPRIASPAPCIALKAPLMSRKRGAGPGSAFPLESLESKAADLPGTLACVLAGSAA